MITDGEYDCNRHWLSSLSLFDGKTFITDRLCFLQFDKMFNCGHFPSLNKKNKNVHNNLKKHKLTVTNNELLKKQRKIKIYVYPVLILGEVLRSALLRLHFIRLTIQNLISELLKNVDLFT